MAESKVPTDIYGFVSWDYVVVTAVLFLTAFVGLYHVWKAQNIKNTREFLVANNGTGTIPLVLSMVATTLTPGALLGMPMEGYSNGIQMIMAPFSMILCKVFAAFAIIPVLYNANVDTFNQYVEYRFNRYLRTIPAFLLMVQSSIFIAAITNITATVLSQATGLNVWHSILIITILCITYSSLGGVTAVIWTDVVQIFVIFSTCAIFFVMAINAMGGFSDIWEKNYYGKRTTFAYLTPNPNSQYTIWSLVIGYFFIGLGYSATSQSELQRQVANRKLSGAQIMSISTSVLVSMVMQVGVFIGMIAYANHYNCDPVLNKQLRSRDEITPLFAMKLFHNIPGLSGLYVSGILCATLSTLSSVINAASTITLIDFIKPFVPKSSDGTSKLISKAIGCIYGLLVIGLTGVVRHFGSLIQTFQAVVGTSIGPTAGILLLGIFFPWATSKGATAGYVASLAFAWWLSIDRIHSGARYVTAPMTTVNCNSTINFNSSLAIEKVAISTTSTSGLSFFSGIIPLWYCAISIVVVIVVGLTVSVITGSENLEKLNPNYISPLTKWIGRKLPESIQKKTGLKTLLDNDKKSEKTFEEVLNLYRNHRIEKITEGKQLSLGTFHVAVTGSHAGRIYCNQLD